jgi:hypothetical protein
MSRLINRNPFARTELHRKTVQLEIGSGQTCGWCGFVRDGGKLYRYYTETDGGRTNDHSGLFCCKSCHDSYHS